MLEDYTAELKRRSTATLTATGEIRTFDTMEVVSAMHQ